MKKKTRKTAAKKEKEIAPEKQRKISGGYLAGKDRRGLGRTTGGTHGAF